MDNAPSASQSTVRSNPSNHSSLKRKLELEAAVDRAKILKKAVEKERDIELDIIDKRLKAEIANLENNLDAPKVHADPTPYEKRRAVENWISTQNSLSYAPSSKGSINSLLRWTKNNGQKK